MSIKQSGSAILSTLASLALLAAAGAALAQDAPQTLFTNVHVFDGVQEQRIENANVLVEGNLIKTVSTAPIEADGATVIDGGGRTLMPGLIDAHWHTMYIGIPIQALVNGDMIEVAARAVPKAEAVLMRGFTTVRDMGGPAESLKKIIDAGVVLGPRILPSGPGISQSSGHFDYRDYRAIPQGDGDTMDYWYRTRMFALADGVPEMLRRVRENLRMRC
jgi:imidazolonepropionase-like amidohydrolase